MFCYLDICKSLFFLERFHELPYCRVCTGQLQTESIEPHPSAMFDDLGKPDNTPPS